MADRDCITILEGLKMTNLKHNIIPDLTTVNDIRSIINGYLTISRVEAISITEKYSFDSEGTPRSTRYCEVEWCNEVGVCRLEFSFVSNKEGSFIAVLHCKEVPESVSSNGSLTYTSMNSDCSMLICSIMDKHRNDVRNIEHLACVDFS